MIENESSCLVSDGDVIEKLIGDQMNKCNQTIAEKIKKFEKEYEKYSDEEMVYSQGDGTITCTVAYVDEIETFIAEHVPYLLSKEVDDLIKIKMNEMTP